MTLSRFQSVSSAAALAVVLVMGASAPVTADHKNRGHKWAAIGVGEIPTEDDGGLFFPTVSRMSAPSDARNAVLDICEIDGGWTCDVVIVTQGSCAAVATDGEQDFAVEDYGTHEDAENDALDWCKDEGDSKYCEVAASVCADDEMRK